MKVVPLFFLGAAAIVFGGFLPEAGADVIQRAMYINSGGAPVYDYVFQADRCNVRSWRRGYDYRNHGSYGYPSSYYFGSSYDRPLCSYSAYPVRSYYHQPVGLIRSYPIFGSHYYGGYHGYLGGVHAHGAFSVGGLRVHVNF